MARPEALLSAASFFATESLYSCNNTLPKMEPMRSCLLLLFLSAIAKAQTDFSVINQENYEWGQDDWSLTTTRFVPGQYQSRMSLANGYASIGSRLS
jgi:hypothetical protein